VNARRAAALTAICLATAGCASTLKPAIEMPSSTITLSTSIDAGKIEPPDPNRTFDLPPNTILLVALTEYPGFDWHAGNAQNTSILSAGATEGQDVCPTGATVCGISEAEQYIPHSTGTTTITFTLVATGDSSLSPTAPGPLSMPTGGSACPAGITMPPPSADIGCVLGTVTLTVKVG
jgi:hypothetical protein